MKQACEKTGLSYETLKFYCNQGLVPKVKRDSGNRRIFSDRGIAWINSLSCLKNCGMGIQEMREYLALYLEGPSGIPERKVILEAKRQQLMKEQKRIVESIEYIDWKQSFYDDVLTGRREYISNLLPEEENRQWAGTNSRPFLCYSMVTSILMTEPFRTASAS